MINELYARLAEDTSTQQSLFTGSFSSIEKIELTLLPPATGTANFAIYENDEEKVNKRVKAGQSVSLSSQSGSTVNFYVNSYNNSDLPQVRVTVLQ